MTNSNTAPVWLTDEIVERMCISQYVERLWNNPTGLHPIEKAQARDRYRAALTAVADALEGAILAPVKVLHAELRDAAERRDDDLLMSLTWRLGTVLALASTIEGEVE